MFATPGPLDFVAIATATREFWEREHVFSHLVAKNRAGPRLSFLDGPITANNPMGIHHAWGRTFKDVVQRYRALCGYEQRFQNGFDCQGLWVEVEVEKTLGFNSKREIESYGLERFSRSEEHTSELQSRQYLVCRLLLEIGRAHVCTPVTPISRMPSFASKKQTPTLAHRRTERSKTTMQT